MRVFFDLEEFRSAMRRDIAELRAGHQVPKGDPIGGFDGSDVPLGAEDCIPKSLPTRSQLQAYGVAKFAVSYDPARLKHPIKQPFEIARVVVGCVFLLVHLLRLERRRLRIK